MKALTILASHLIPSLCDALFSQLISWGPKTPETPLCDSKVTL